MPARRVYVLSSVARMCILSCMVHVRKLFAFYLIVVLEERECVQQTGYGLSVTLLAQDESLSLLQLMLCRD